MTQFFEYMEKKSESSETTLEQFTRSNLTFVDVEKEKKDSADKHMIVDIFNFVLKKMKKFEAEEIVVVLISGDTDFHRTLKKIKKT